MSTPRKQITILVVMFSNTLFFDPYFVHKINCSSEVEGGYLSTRDVVAGQSPIPDNTHWFLVVYLRESAGDCSIHVLDHPATNW